MNIPTPARVASIRTARLVAEFTSETGKVNPHKRAAEIKRAAEAEVWACTPDWCHVCSRPTEHFGEHSEEQLLAWAAKPGLAQSMLV
jgi:hypothetical protein